MTSLTGADPATSTIASQTTRLHGLDALRAGALLLGIVLHSLLPFIPWVPWLVVDSQSSWLASIPVYAIHLFRMALFMLLAGYFGRMVLHRRGTGSYLRDRAIRIGLPLIAFWPVAVLPLGILAMVNVEVNDLDPVVPPQADDPLAAFTPGQLWFLWVLLQCVVIVVVVRAVTVRLLGEQRCARLGDRIGRLLSSPGGVLLAAAPYLAALLIQGTVLGGIIAPETVRPSASALIAYLGAFMVGWVLHARADALIRIARFWPVHLATAVLLSVLGFTQSEPTSSVPLPISAAVMALAGWSWVYALLGLSTRFLTAERPTIRYLADASYWMYLMHLPLLVGFEILLVRLDWPILVKLGLTWAVVGALLLVSYHLLVRSTPIGQWLNGRRYPFRWPWTRPD